MAEQTFAPDAAKAKADAPWAYGRGEERLAHTYAEALLEAADKKGEADRVADDIEAVAALLAEQPKVEALFSSPAVPHATKGPLLQRAFGGKVSPLVEDFLQLVNRNDRLFLLREIGAAFRELRDAAAKRVRVTVSSAAELPADQLERLKSELSAALGRDPVVVPRVDPDLLGGIVVRVGDKVYDWSVRTRLDTLRTRFLVRGSHEVQLQRDRFSS